VAVVEGYTDVIAAHQVGLCNVVGTLGTALGEDHVQGLRHLADLVVLVFDGDTAGQTAADRALEFFLGHELDVRILSLPANLDPCDFLLKEGVDAFRELVAGAVDPLAFVLERAATRFDFGAIEGSRRAAEWVLGILSRARSSQPIGLDFKLGKCLDNLSVRLNQPVDELKKRLRELRQLALQRPGRGNPGSGAGVNLSRTEAQPEVPGAASSLPPPPIRLRDLDPLDRELVQIVLNEPGLVSELVSRVTVSSLRDAPLRAILQACYDLHGEGQSPSIAEVMHRLDDPQIHDLAAGFLLPLDPEPMPENMRLASWQERLKHSLETLAERERQHRIGDLRRALAETNESTEPDAYRALQLEYRRLITQRPDTKKTRPDPSFRA
jgi:DNA primase